MAWDFISSLTRNVSIGYHRNAKIDDSGADPDRFPPFYGNRSVFFNKYIVLELHVLQSNYNLKICINEIIFIRGKWLTQNTWKWHLGEPKSKNSFGGTSPPPTLNGHYFSWIRTWVYTLNVGVCNYRSFNKFARRPYNGQEDLAICHPITDILRYTKFEVFQSAALRQFY